LNDVGFALTANPRLAITNRSLNSAHRPTHPTHELWGRTAPLPTARGRHLAVEVVAHHGRKRGCRPAPSDGAHRGPSSPSVPCASATVATATRQICCPARDDPCARQSTPTKASPARSCRRPRLLLPCLCTMTPSYSQRGACMPPPTQGTRHVFSPGRDTPVHISDRGEFLDLNAAIGVASYPMSSLPT
jgi:hypothetical protein